MAINHYQTNSRPVIVLAYYYKQSKASTRHKWHDDTIYDRLDKRYSALTVDEAPLPNDVAQEALDKFVTLIKVVKEL